MSFFLTALLTSAALFPQENRSGVPIPAVPDFQRDHAETFGRQIAEFADLYDRGWKDEIWQGKMILFDASGDSVERSTVRYTLENPDKGDKSLVRFMTPAEYKGVAALTHENPAGNDDQWLYLPSNRKVQRISGANKTASFQGTEFTYEDLAAIEVNKYKWRFLEEVELRKGEETIACYKVEGVPQYRDTGYSRLLFWFRQDNFRREQVEYYDRASQLLKVMQSRGWEAVHGRFQRPAIMEMKNVQTKKSTLLEVEKRFLNLSLYKSRRTGKARPNLTEEFFTTRALQSR
ncbi:MAG: outer membrane lipoprotein-sorting protein [Planctomycetota bacterium]|nr:MAG: outer membrane lipoprotein-sorting protein [Planctomycetota bacterium]